MTYRDLARRILELSSSIVGAAQEFEALDPGITQQLLEHAESLQRLSLAADENLRRDPLPPGQARVLAFVRQFMFDHRMPPTRAEIALGLGMASENGAQDHLKALERKGHIEILPGQARGIRLVTARPVLKLKESRPEPGGSQGRGRRYACWWHQRCLGSLSGKDDGSRREEPFLVVEHEEGCRGDVRITGRRDA